MFAKTVLSFRLLLMSAISDVKVNKKQVGKPGPHSSANNGNAKKKEEGCFSENLYPRSTPEY